MPSYTFLVTPSGIVPYKEETPPLLFSEMGIIETMRCCKGTIPLWGFHLSRLQNGMQDLKWPILNLEIWKEWTAIHQPILAAHPQNVIRWQWQKIDANTLQCTVRIKEIPSIPLNITLGIYPIAVENNNYNTLYKNTERAFYTAAATYAQAHKWYDALLINHKKEIIESTHSNLIVLQNGQWLSPTLATHGIHGVMRSYLLQHLDITIKASDIATSMLAEADAVLLCNAVRGIQLVDAIGNIHYTKHDKAYSLQQQIHYQLGFNV
jgi:4-amino-4-deoxychorismate lyase